MSGSRIDGLTQKQRAFANYIAEGLNGTEAYRKAYPDTVACDKTCATHACREKKKPHVAAYIASLVAKQEQARFLTRERKREILAQLAEKKACRPGERIKAIEVDNTMTGDNAPQQVQVFGLGELLALVRKKSK